ncbi:MAG: hypothetical protein ACLGGV_09225 [Bacteroidia bacterium]
MLKKILKYLALFTLILALMSSSTKLYVREYLAFSFTPGPNMELVTFAVVTTNNGRIVKKEFISTTSFINKATGKELTKANPYQINIFEAYGIDECFYEISEEKNQITDKESPKKKCTTLDDLWRLHYKTHPQYKINFFDGNESIFGGWSKEEKHPSDGQLKILQDYGIVNTIDFFYGENMFLLFKDMQNPTWVAKYKAS